MTTANYDQRILKTKNPYPKGPNDWRRFFSFNTDAKVIGCLLYTSDAADDP